MLVTVFITMLILLAEHQAYGDSLNVFYPSTITSTARQKALADGSLGMEPVTVFAKFKDFEDFQKVSPATHIIVPSSYPEYNKQYTCSHQFTSHGENFKFQLITVDKSWNLNKTGDGILGVVDELGRREMKDYIEKILPGQKFKQVTRVAATEDLFGLAALDNANYILVSALHVVELKERFKLNTAVVTESIPIRHPFICSKHGSKFDVAKLTPQMIKALGYNGVTEIK